MSFCSWRSEEIYKDNWKSGLHLFTFIYISFSYKLFQLLFNHLKEMNDKTKNGNQF
jgi:hypothetical protein